MGGEAVLRHIRAHGKSGRDHPPADETLEAAERQQSDQRQPQAPFHPAAQPEHQKRQAEDEADGARQQAVRPLPPEDRLERIERHALVQLRILRDALVELELFLPFRNRQRRDDPVDRLPLGDGQARIGQPRGAAHQHQTEERDDDDLQPAPQQQAVSFKPVHGLGSAGLRDIQGRHGVLLTFVNNVHLPLICLMPPCKTRGEALRHAVAAGRGRSQIGTGGERQCQFG